MRFLLLLVALALFLAARPAVLGLDGREVLALDSIYNAYPQVMSGFGWNTNFDDACDESTSWNLTISCTDEHITSMTLVPSLGHTQTKFALSDAWAGLVHLEEIVITGLNITGTIPPSFGQFVNLSILAMPYNELDGSIPDFSATNLSIIELSANSLVGTLPGYLFSMPTIKEVRLGGNYLHGTIPDENWSQSLTVLILRDNVLNGSIPTKATLAPALNTLLLDTNRLTGTVPYRLFAAPIRSFSLSGNMIDICSGRLVPQPTRLLACSILPQFFDQKECNCTQKWSDECGVLPESCPECTQPPPTPDFKCSTTEAGWWIIDFHLKSGQTADFRGTSANSPAVVLGSFTTDLGSEMLFGFNSAVQTRSSLKLFGSTQVLLTVPDTVYLGNQLSGDLYEKSWLPVTRTYISSYSPIPQGVSGWSPEIDIPEVCHFMTADVKARNVPNPFKNLNSYTVTFQYQSAIRFRCSPWIIVIGVFSGASFLGLVLFLSCYIYTKVQARKRERAHMPLLQ